MKARTADEMRLAHGPGPDGKVCRDCWYCVLRPRRSNQHRHVCLKAASSANAHGDVQRPMWQKKWSACGLYKERVV